MAAAAPPPAGNVAVAVLVGVFMDPPVPLPVDGKVDRQAVAVATAGALGLPYSPKGTAIVLET